VCTPRPNRVPRPAVLLAALLLSVPRLDAQPVRTGSASTIPAPAAAPGAVAIDPASLHALRYRMVGPSRGGRVTAVAGHPAHPSTYYFGGTGGGVWRTDDDGRSWHPVSDGQIAVGSIGAIRVADSDPDVVWVGTGSAAIRSNVSIGNGVYRSVDGGRTWTHAGLARAGMIGAIETHPRNADIAYVAALGNIFGRNPERGVFRTRDGGRTWEHVLFVSDSTGAVDLAINPHDPDEIYASLWRAERKPWTIISGAREGGIYKSSDGGDTWIRLGNGLPDGLRGKSSVSIARSSPNIVYALIEAPGDEGGLYRSDDRGASWRRVSNQAGLLERPFYYTYVDVDPKDADRVWVNNLALWLSEDAGRTWRRVATPHGDNHGMWINPDDPARIVQSNDGGANVTTDGGRTWSTQHNQPTAELYQVDLDDRFPYWLYAGQQDNTTIAVPSVPPLSLPGGHTAYWRDIGGCETGPAVPKPGSDGDIVYANCKGRFGRYSARTGQEKQYYVGAANMYGHNPRDLEFRFQRVAPIVISPHDPDVVYHASQYLHRTRDEGVTWETISPDLTANDPRGHVFSGEPITRDITGEEFYSTIYAVAESPRVRGVIWVGANDGPVHVTRDGGRTWRNITPPDLPPGGRVQTVEPSPHRDGSAYIAVLRYMFDDWRPYLYRTDDWGGSWTRISGPESGFPQDHPTRVVREDPDREGLLYAGTEFGMFISFDDGASWHPFQLNLPAVPVTDLKVYRKDLVLATQGRSFWILDDLTPLHQLRDDVLAKRVHLFVPREAYRARWPGFGSSPDAPQYPPPGAGIHYWLGAPAADGVRLEVVDAAGAVVATFASAAPGETARTAEQGMRAPPPAPTAAGTRLEATPGLHRFVWDLRTRGARGPTVPPGRYTVRLTAGGVAAEQPLVLRMDPRVAADGVTQADLEEQYAFNLKLLDLQAEARAVLERAEGARAAAARRGDARRVAALDAVITELRTRTDQKYPQPMLIDQIAYLYGMTNTADQRLGRDAHERYDALRARLEAQKAALVRAGA
jgi:photosystem II stability/assembly factor-like uncharacterized protein